VRVDPAGIVSGLSAEWNDFLRERFVGCLTPATVGTRFLPRGGGAETLYAQLFEHVRRFGPLSLDVWSATATVATKLELTLHRRDGQVELALEPLFEREHDPALRFFDPETPRGDDGIRACGFCQRLYAFRWAEPELALLQLRVDPYGLQPQLKPDVCLDCEHRIRSLVGIAAAS
jgi:hypothetical protein